MMKTGREVLANLIFPTLRRWSIAQEGKDGIFHT